MQAASHSTAAQPPVFLFSVDLEDVRTMIPDGERFRERVPATVGRYLEFLDRCGMRCTFFTVGNVARRYPALIHRIIAAGHEIACHSSEHTTLDQHDRNSLRNDLLRSLDDLSHAGAGRVDGFRAPMLSLVAGTSWAYEVLADLGFRYSSSVLPARSPVFGWSGFPPACTRTMSGVWEIPVTLSSLPGFKVPFAGGMYFRLLPFAATRRLFQCQQSDGRAVVGYFHPYDIDTDQEHFMHPAISNNRVLNWLMYCNRSRVLPRLQRLVSQGMTIMPYAEYLDRMHDAERTHR